MEHVILYKWARVGPDAVHVIVMVGPVGARERVGTLSFTNEQWDTFAKAAHNKVTTPFLNIRAPVLMLAPGS